MRFIQKAADAASSPLAFFCCLLVVGSILVPCIALGQQETSRRGGRVYRDRIQPHWFADSTKFWYRNDLPNGQKEFVVVDATKGMKSKDFDHDSVASTIQTSDPGVDVSQSIRTKNGDDTEISFENKSPTPVEIFWISGDGKRVSYGKIAPGARKDQHTFGGHTWVVVNDKREDLGVYDATDQPLTIKIDGTKIAREPTPDRRNRGRNRAQSGTSPDGQWKAFVKDHNVFIKGVADVNEQPETALSSDGTPENVYDSISWSANSKTVIAFRIEPGEEKEVYLVQSSPEGGGRAKLQARPYALPGDKFAKCELNLFHVASREQIKPLVDRFEHERARPSLRWNAEGTRFTYQQNDRGHQRFRLIEVDVASGNVRNIVDESSPTFIWTAHADNVSTVTWLESAEELLYVSERSGWRHIYLVDSQKGTIKNAITAGEWVFRGIEQIDETDRRIWFRASGCFPGQDPYLIHFGRVNFDGSDLVWLTEGDGNHSLQYSPNRQYLIDTYSRVDLAPISELRRVADGRLVCELERAEVDGSKSNESDFPTVMSAKGRDGETDIWGFVCLPRNFDPSQKYPVIEDIYAGPHGSHVPKSFSPNRRYESLTQLGFIVVKIDGMGTANRSKTFHDVCWHNLKDAGLEDRILWIKSAAEKIPQMDLSRVGIYGTSAGGQNAAGAVLFHPEFYKVGVAACGCHDNRMDKASWNEQWMGYPVGKHYGESSNIDNAHRLDGKLLLTVGEMDTNVPPESTMRFADALIKANKDFDLLVVPNAGHGMGGSYGQRKMHDFFVRHLLRN